VDTFTFNARDVNVDELITDEQELNRILYMASLYWTGSKAITKPFYIKARSKNESGIRYAVIFFAQLHDDSNPYAQPFFSRSPASTDLIVPITHGVWLDYPPGADGYRMHENVLSTINSAITHRSQGTYYLPGGANVYLSNSLSHNGITHIYYGGSSSNLLDISGNIKYKVFSGTTSPYYTYFGISRESDSHWLVNGKFESIYLNITTPASGATGAAPDIRWEIRARRTIAGTPEWIEVKVDDKTNALRNPGVVSFRDSHIFWDENAVVSGTTGCWARVKGTGLSTIPEITDRHPATVMLPYFDVLLTPKSNSEQNNLLNFGGLEKDLIPRSEQLSNPIFPLLYVTDEPSIGPPVRMMHFSGHPSTSDTGSGRGYSWQIRDSSSEFHQSVERKVSIVFEKEGSFWANLVIYDKDTGVRKSMYVNSYWFIDTLKWRVALDFTVSDSIPKVGEEITFDPSKSFIDIPTDTIRTSTWTFGDGTPSVVTSGSVPIVKHTYVKAGQFDTSLGILCVSGIHSVVSKLGCISVSDKAVASFVATTRRGLPPLRPEFDASSSTTTVGTIVSYEWEFGDGTTGTGVRPGKIYTKRGNYSVKLKVTNSNGDTDEAVLSGYIYVDSKEFSPGDIGVFLELDFSQVHREYGDAVPTRLYIGAKSLVHKDAHNFQGIIPVYGNIHGSSLHEVQPTGAWWKHYDATIVKSSIAYTGYAIKRDCVVRAENTETQFISLEFRENIYHAYQGTYRVFMRLNSSEDIAYGDIYFSAGTGTEYVKPGGDMPSETRKVTDIFKPDYTTVLDFGSLTIGEGEGGFAITGDRLNFYWNVGTSTVGREIYILDVVLIPQDEWFAEIPLGGHYGYRDNHELRIGSLTPSGDLDARIVDTIQNTIQAMPAVIPNIPLSFVGNDIRFTTFFGTRSRVDSDPARTRPYFYTDFNYISKVSSVMKVNKYFSSRGKR